MESSFLPNVYGIGLGGNDILNHNEHPRFEAEALLAHSSLLLWRIDLAVV